MVTIMGFASSLLNEIIHFSERRSSRKTKVEDSVYVCRDELDKKKKPKIKKQVKFDLDPKYQHAEEERVLESKKKNSSLEKCNQLFHEEKRVLLQSDDHANNNGVIKVKILMKKEDAARLLLKCKEGGVLEFMDVAQELGQVSSSNVRFLSS